MAGYGYGYNPGFGGFGYGGNVPQNFEQERIGFGQQGYAVV